MTAFEAVASLLIQILRGLASRLVTDELRAWTPWVIERIIRSAVSILPESEQERSEEEWRSHINEVPGPLAKVYQAFGLLFAAREIAHPLSAHDTWTVKDLAKRAFDIGASSRPLSREEVESQFEAELAKK